MTSRKRKPLEPAAPVLPGTKTEAPQSAAPGRPLSAALRRLDDVLSIAVEQQARRLGPASLLDPWLGMHLELADVQRLLAQHEASPLAPAQDVAGLLAAAVREVPAMQQLSQALGLADLDLAALLLVLAPDVDLRYERIYGYLQDDITHKRPSLDFIANLLVVEGAQRSAVCARFSRSAPLRLHGLVQAMQEHPRSPLAQEWQTDAVWRTWFLQGEAVEALEGRDIVVEAPRAAAMLVLEPATRALLEQACEAAGRMPLRLCLHGEHGAGKLEAARAVAQRLGLQLLVLDLRAAAGCSELSSAVAHGARAACLFRGLLYVHGVGRLEQRDPQMLRSLLAALAAAPCHLVLSCVAAPPPVHADPLPLLRIELRYPGREARAVLWRRALRQHAATLSEGDLAALAGRFSLSGAQIFQACAEASTIAFARSNAVPTHGDLVAAVRSQCGGELARLATRVAPHADFSHLVVPVEVRTQLREICARVATRETVGHEWAQDSVHARAAGVTALFVGPSGTGKTLSAEALAHELGLDLYRIDLAGIVSKYIGETEKNLDRVFWAAAHANAVLFFDEADALFGKRSEVKDAHDRYANIEVAYLLQKMEQFEGLAILATNLKQNLDEAFARRLTFTVNFPFPEETERRQLWEQLWPSRAPRAADVDLAWFAHEYRLSGGNIRNAVLAAAHLAAADGLVITRAHLLHATRREYQKLGKNLLAVPAPVHGATRNGAAGAIV